MINLIKSEILKQKRTFSNIIIFLAPAIIILLAWGIMWERYVEGGAYNWWYTMILPFVCTIISASISVNDKKKNYHGLFSTVIYKRKLWYAKIITGSLYLFITCMVFFIILTGIAFTFESAISPLQSFAASIILFITFAWQVPLFMIAGDKLGVFFSVIISIICNFGIAVICAVESYWWVPFAIPARLMCSIIGVLPNGLMAESDNILRSSSVVFPGIMICIILYIIISLFSGIAFERKEV